MISAFRRAETFRGDVRGDHLAAPDRGQRLPGPAAPPGAPGRAAAGGRRAGAGALAAAAGRADPSADSEHVAGRAWPRCGTLPPDQQAALVLVDMLGYPVADAAEVLGVPVGTVKSRCSRGRVRLLPAPGPPAEPIRGRAVQPAQEGG